MVPVIRPGEILQIHSVQPNRISPGDVVLFMRYGRLFAHRVVGRGAGWLVTRGDAVSDCDPPLADSEVLGVVTGIIRGRDFDANDGAAFQPLEAPSLAQRMVAFAIRRSDLVYRIVLKWHRLRAGVPARVLEVRALQPASE